ncbi:MAG: tetratricopeptide repeat protein [Burkholderiaceae bacterium]
MSLLIKALKQAERSHRSADSESGEEPGTPAPAKTQSASTADGASIGSTDAIDHDSASGRHETDTPDSAPPTGRDAPETSVDWNMTLEFQPPAPPRSATDQSQGREGDNRSARRARAATPAEAPAIAMMEMDAFDAPASADAPPANDDRGEPGGELAFAPLDETDWSSDGRADIEARQTTEVQPSGNAEQATPPSPLGLLNDGDAVVSPAPARTEQEQVTSRRGTVAPTGEAKDTAASGPIAPGDPVASPPVERIGENDERVAKSKSKRLSRGSLALLLLAGLGVGGWLGYESLRGPDFASLPVSGLDPMATPDHGMNPTSPVPVPGGDPTWTSADLATIASAAPLDRMIAEGGTTATADQDGRVIVFDTPAAPGPRPIAKPGAKPAVSTRPVASASTRATATQAPLVSPPADRAPAETAPATRPAPIAPASRADDSASADAKTPALPRLKRSLSQAERIALVKTSAYRAFGQNRLDESEKLYRDVLVRNPLDTDAWVGLAAIASRRGDTGLARQQYERALTIDPNDPVARAGLLSVTRDEDPTARESRLRNLMASGLNGAGIAFELANTLAEQDRWVEAQQAYFEASSLEPTNPDFAFNLAISLDRLHQPGAALQHYQRAIALAEQRAAAFDPGVARQRIEDLRSTLNR